MKNIFYSLLFLVFVGGFQNQGYSKCNNKSSICKKSLKSKKRALRLKNKIKKFYCKKNNKKNNIRRKQVISLNDKNLSPKATELTKNIITEINESIKEGIEKKDVSHKKEALYQFLDKYPKSEKINHEITNIKINIVDLFQNIELLKINNNFEKETEIKSNLEKNSLKIRLNLDTIMRELNTKKEEKHDSKEPVKKNKNEPKKKKKSRGFFGWIKSLFTGDQDEEQVKNNSEKDNKKNKKNKKK